MMSTFLYLPFILAIAHAQFELPIFNATGLEFELKQRPIYQPHRYLSEIDGPASPVQSGWVQARPASPFKDSSFPDSIFVETLKIGTPPRDIVLQMDTGSWQLWTYDTDCTPTDTRINFYDPAISNTSNRIDNSSWSAGYGNGNFVSNLSSIYTDTVRFAKVTLHNQAIGRPIESCKTAKGQVTQGLIGLGYGSWPNAHPPQNTFFTELAPTLKSPLFTASLNYRAPGYYDFGFIDKRKFIGNITYFPVPYLPNPNLWGVNATGYAVGKDAQLTRFDSGALPTFIDSGGAFMFLPPKVVDAYYAQAPFVSTESVDVNHNGNNVSAHLFPCLNELPDLTIGVGNYQTTIPGLLLKGAEWNATTCITNLMASGGASIPANAGLFGLPFLRTTFTVFRNPVDEQPSVGLAKKPIARSYVTNDDRKPQLKPAA